MTIQEMKAFCAENNIAVEGNKRLKQTWEAAIENWKLIQAQAVVIKEETIATVNEATEVSEKASVQIEGFVVEVVKVLTSEQAIGLYRSALRMVMLAIVFAALTCIKIGTWCWNHRSDTAVYHWVEAWLDSPQGKSTIAHGLIIEWVVASWGEIVWRLSDNIRDRVSAGGDRALVRLGLSGGTIEIQ